MTVKEIVKAYLEVNGYDGLYATGDCACKIDDLMACDESLDDCMAGYLQKPCHENADCEYNFVIGEKKGVTCNLCLRE